jgi:hypothetical protein
VVASAVFTLTFFPLVANLCENNKPSENGTKYVIIDAPVIMKHDLRRLDLAKKIIVSDRFQQKQPILSST